MPPTARQSLILERLSKDGQVEVDRLASELAVTTQTVRRDLSELCDRGFALRTHGGAKRRAPQTVVQYEERRLSNRPAKAAIAKAAAKAVQPGTAISLNIGTTTEMVAEALTQHNDLTVVTNNINIVQILRPAPLRMLHLIGGTIRQSDGAIVGEDAVAQINTFHVDTAIIGASAIDASGAVLDFDAREVAVARALLANARRKILVADHSKFSVTAPYRICALEALDHIITDSAPPAAFAQAVLAAGTDIIITGESS